MILYLYFLFNLIYKPRLEYGIFYTEKIEVDTGSNWIKNLHDND